jgi:hypothetical protein
MMERVAAASLRSSSQSQYPNLTSQSIPGQVVRWIVKCVSTARKRKNKTKDDVAFKKNISGQPKNKTKHDHKQINQQKESKQRKGCIPGNTFK